MYRVLKLKESEKLEEKDTIQEYKNFCADMKLNPKDKKSVDKYMNVFSRMYAQYNGLATLKAAKQKEEAKLKEFLNESSTEEYWDATEIDGRAFMNLMKFNFGTDSKGNNYIVTNDNNEVARFRADSDEEAKKKFQEEFLKESTLTEADEEEEVEEIEDDLEKAEETEEDLEDTVDSEEDQEENPVEEESDLDKQLDEIREVLVDLDLRLYKIMNDEEEFYIIGRLDPESNQVEMLVDTQPADTIEVDINPDGTEDAEQVLEKEEEVENIPEETDIATRFDYVKLPNKFEQIKDMFPRYGEGLTPDHEAIMEYLMNLLIEQNPRAAKEKAEENIPDEEVPVDTEVVAQEEIPGEEDLEDED